MEASRCDSVVKALVLSSWDHVLGPTTTYLWRSQVAIDFWSGKLLGRNHCSDGSSSDNHSTRNICDKSCLSECSPSNAASNSCGSGSNSELVSCMDLNGSNTLKSEDMFDTISYLVGQMLHGHLIAPCPSRTICTKEVFVCDKEVFLYAVVFQQKYSGRFKSGDNEYVPHCLALIFSYNDWNFYHSVRRFVDEYMRKMVTTLADGLDEFGGLENSASAIASIVVLVKDLDEKLWTLKVSAAERKGNKIPYSLTYFNAHHKCNRRFLERAIASHLHTCGYSVVTGESVEEINLMVHTLSIFLEPSERVCVRYASSEDTWPYLPGLCIQGLLKDIHGKSNISVEAVLQNPHPTTLIDLSHEKVRQSPFPPQSHLPLQCKTSAGKQSEKCWTTDSAFKTVTEAGKLIPNFIQEASLILSEESRGEYSEYFFSYLKNKATVLLNLMDKISIDSKKPLLNVIMSGIGVSEMADLHVILGIAEKLHPGVRSKLMSLTKGGLTS